MRKRWAVLFSGRGSNFGAMLDLIHQENVVFAVSSKKSAQGLLRAKRMGIETFVLDKEINWRSLGRELEKRQISHIFLLGFMRLLPADFVKQWEGKIWNLHPSLLPAFPGKNSIEESYQAKAPMGVTIHEVIVEMDAGPIQLQKEIKRQDKLTDCQLEISMTEQFLVREFARRVS
jgi:phosphoribosylglycinamide formyltransferase 1